MEDKNNEVTGWVGWLAFASVMLFLTGVFHIIAGLVGLFRDTIYTSSTNTTWILSYNQWGWTHIITGGIMLIAAASLLQGGLFGRAFAVIVALLSAIANMAFIPIYPLWSLLIITIDVLVIWAATVHGKELRESSV